MKKLSRIVALAFCGLFGLAMFGCGGGTGGGGGGGRGSVKLTVWAVINENNSDAMKQVIKTFNERNDRYQVTLVPKTSGYSAQLGGTLRGSTPPNIVQIDDRYYKGYIEEGYLTPLEEYFVDKKDESGNVVRKASELDLSDIWETAVDRFRYDPETHVAGGDSPLYGLPAGIAPGVMYYNASALKSGGVNIVSIDEEDVDAYNRENGTSYLGHGYYVYDEAPATGLTAKDGKYHVFNNRIPMNWDELVAIGKLFTQNYNSASPTHYGFFNEWWFSFGWSVGGDCLEWDEGKDQYVFALGEDAPNYLVTKEATVNGTAYKPGDILSYTDKHFVEGKLSENDGTVSALTADQTLYALPSIRDAFTLFLQLPQSTSKNVTDNVKGLQISPTPTIIGNKSKKDLLTSRETAFVVENYTEAYGIGKEMARQKLDWDIAPLYQYREYNDDGSLKTVNGTPVVGKRATHSNTVSYAIPANAKAKDGAFEFIEYMAGKEVQEILMSTNLYVPNQKSLVYGEKYANLTDNYYAKNKYGILDAAASSSVGDWSYLENGEWVNIWANVLNTDVRNGVMTLDEFFRNPCIAETNAKLAQMKAKKYNG